MTELCLLRVSRACDRWGPATSRAGVMPEIVLPATPPVVPAVLPLIPVSPVVEVLILRVLKLEEDLWRREGVGWLGPDSKWFAF